MSRRRKYKLFTLVGVMMPKLTSDARWLGVEWGGVGVGGMVWGGSPIILTIVTREVNRQSEDFF